MKAKDVKVGCCGFPLSQGEYFRRFPVVEIQSTFYRIPRLNTGEKWRQIAPRDFEFTMKAWQLITHEPSSPTYRRLGEAIDPSRFHRYGSFRYTPEILDAWKQTEEFARALKASNIVFQCPASFSPTRENADRLRRFFSAIDRGKFQFIWEPRGSWPEELIRQLCQELELIHGVDPFKNPPLFGKLQYFRLHGITGYSYAYSDGDLESLTAWVRNKTSYVLFNNKRMKGDALRFQGMIRKEKE